MGNQGFQTNYLPAALLDIWLRWIHDVSLVCGLVTTYCPCSAIQSCRLARLPV